MAGPGNGPSQRHGNGHARLQENSEPWFSLVFFYFPWFSLFFLSFSLGAPWAPKIKKNKKNWGGPRVTQGLGEAPWSFKNDPRGGQIFSFRPFRAKTHSSIFKMHLSKKRIFGIFFHPLGPMATPWCPIGAAWGPVVR